MKEPNYIYTRIDGKYKTSSEEPGKGLHLCSEHRENREGSCRVCQVVQVIQDGMEARD